MISMEKDMDEKQQPNEDQQLDKRFLSVLHEVETIKNTYVVEAQLQWYAKRVGLPRFFFNLSGILIILLSVSIPYLATLEGPWRNIVLPIVALMVAGLTGLSSFFRWDTTMKSHIQAGLRLQYWLSLWDLQIIEAKHELNVERAIEKALQATQRLLENAQDTSSTETEEHFQFIKSLPERRRTLLTSGQHLSGSNALSCPVYALFLFNGIAE
jgi:hypothetical protein